MGIKIIRESEHEKHVSFFRNFRSKDMLGCGFSFLCDEQGNTTHQSIESENNYIACLTGSVRGEAVIDEGIERYEKTCFRPKIGLCHCGEEVELANFTNTCACGVDYNSCGQALAPREQWGEETGEHWSECL